MKKFGVLFLHLGYWVCYLFLICILVLFLQQRFIFRSYSLFIFLLVFALLPALLCFYLFYTVLFPRFLQKKRTLPLIGTGLITALGCGLLGWLLLNLVWTHIGPANKLPLDQGGFSEVAGMVLMQSVNALLNGITGLIMKGFINWYADIKWKEALNRKNYEMELALLKSQLSPHFLFNTINNIDVLIGKDAAKASDYLNKLSGMLRFMLYETKTGKIALSKELAYIEQYIDLQRIRTSNTEYIHYSVTGSAGKRQIEPMLFIPFIENAFKHAANKKEENAIDIQIDIKADRLSFVCNNNYQKTGFRQPGEHNGLGNELIQKRLKLLYPGTHTLVVSNENGVYKVALILTGNEN